MTGSSWLYLSLCVFSAFFFWVTSILIWVLFLMELGECWKLGMIDVSRFHKDRLKRQYMEKENNTTLSFVQIVCLCSIKNLYPWSKSLHMIYNRCCYSWWPSVFRLESIAERLQLSKLNLTTCTTVQYQLLKTMIFVVVEKNSYVLTSKSINKS